MLKKAFLFPGQGAQYAGMGRKLCEQYQTASDVFDEASEALSIDMKKLCFEGSAEDLKQTGNTQPAILTVSTAMYRVLTETEELVPDMMAGHSLGEISALTCAGAIGFSDAVKLVRKRGLYMQEAVGDRPVAMAALMSREIEGIKAICEQVSGPNHVVTVSNYNSLTQTVISGHQAAVDQVVKMLEEKRIKVKYLEVSGPFHTALMQPVADRMKEELDKYTYADPGCPVISNVTARPYAGKEDIVSSLTAQIVSPVKWVDSMQYLKKSMIQYGVEIGPGNTLSNMMKTNISEIKVFAYDYPEDAGQLREYVKASYIPFPSRCLGIAVATKNDSDSQGEYMEKVVKPYREIEKLGARIESEKRGITFEEIKQSLNLLLLILRTKKASEGEQMMRIKQLLADTGTEKLFKDYNQEALLKGV